jgi:large subunit ribosomal protein L9
MDVILLEQIQGVGQLGETVSVKRGFARNYLLPRGKALPASKENLAKFETERKERETQMAKAKKAAEKLAEKFSGIQISLQRQASETGMLYGSIKARDIEAALTEKSLDVPRANIQIGSPIKEIGEHQVQLFLHAEVVVGLPVIVSRQSA